MFNIFDFFKNNPLPKSFNEEFGRKKIASRSYKGIKTIDINKIIGTVQRSSRDWSSLKKSNRYIQIKNAVKRRETFPAIKVYQVEDEYYIEDGHHRVLAFKEVGRTFIDAEVIEYQFSDRVKKI